LPRIDFFDTFGAMPSEIATPNTERSFSIEEAFAYCAEITNAHYENFPVASLFLPEEKRPYIQNIYAFARIADDFADELSRSATERLNLLNNWEAQLRLCYEESVRTDVTHPVFVALRETLEKLDIPIEPLQDLITAFKMDVTKNRFATFEDVLHYCKHSANPVGRLVLMVFGYRDEHLYSLSDHLCTALQLANFWQDIALDLNKNRIYIPQSDSQRFGYSEENLRRHIVDDRFRRLMQFEIERTRELFYKGAKLPSLVDRDLRLELRLVWFGGMSILRKTERVHFDVFRHRPMLHAGNKLMILLRGLFIRDLASYQRKPEWDLT
jgi:squalene synthase HpnC